jgi:hypothetical protein
VLRHVAGYNHLLVVGDKLDEFKSRLRDFVSDQEVSCRIHTAMDQVQSKWIPSWNSGGWDGGGEPFLGTSVSIRYSPPHLVCYRGLVQSST